MVVEVNEKTSEFLVDPKFLDVCEYNSVEVCGYSCDEPIYVGLKVVDGILKVKLSRKRKNVARVVVKLNGIRKGFANHRFPERTREQFVANEQFLRSAYPGAGK